jgi:hypothetical protein
MRQFSESTAYRTCESIITNMKARTLDEKYGYDFFEFRAALLPMIVDFFMGHLISRDMLCRLYLHGPEVDGLQLVWVRRQLSEDFGLETDLSHEDCDNYSM